jgi:hypothetical protein
MADTTLKERLVKDLLDFFQETFESVQGIYLDRGTSLFETLDTISAEEASRPVSATCATIAAQVAHVDYYLEILSVYMVGQKPENVDWGHVWKTVSSVSPEEWESSKSRLKQRYEQVITAFKGLEGDENLSDALAMVVHTAYHLGEIRQALCTIKAS